MPRVREVRLVDEHDPEFVRGLIGAVVPSSTVAPSSVGGSSSGSGSSGGLEATYSLNKDQGVPDNNGGGSGGISSGNNNNAVFLPELRSLEFQGNNPTDFQFPKLVVESLSKRWEKDTEDLYAIEVASSAGAVDRGKGSGSGSGRPRCNRARLENVNLELTSEVYVDGLVSQGDIIKEGLNVLMKAGMKVRITNGFDGKTWL